MLDEEAICVIHAIRPLSPTTRVTVHCLGEKAFFSILKRSNNSNLKYSKLMIFFFFKVVYAYILYCILCTPKCFWELMVWTVFTCCSSTADLIQGCSNGPMFNSLSLITLKHLQTNRALNYRHIVFDQL